jgi:hypothetical protein
MPSAPLPPILGRKHKGAHSELVACAWLLSRGYEVFRNVSQHGKVDVIAIRDGVVMYIDVKTACTTKNGYANRTPPPCGSGLVYLLVKLDGSCEWLVPPEAAAEAA